MNHLKHTGHQPSEGNIKMLSNIWKCNNCKNEFTNYPSLMKHRKNEHNQNKVCRYFLDSKCKFSADICWYQHKITTQDDTKHSKFNCKFCDREFPDLHKMMMHKKNDHVQSVQCKNYLNGNCNRASEDCWFMHKINYGENKMDFRKVSNQIPPDRMEGMMISLISKMESLVSQIVQKSQ